MKFSLASFLLLLIATCFSVLLSAQTNTYILNGSATQDKCNCYTLTRSGTFQKGSVWNAAKIDISNSFDFVFSVNLGCQDSPGADGIVFMLQPLSTNVGVSGEGLGFQGVTPSVGISLDTYQNLNLNDPAYDHVGIQTNGVVYHGNDLAGPVPASVNSDNIEDCKWHLFRIVWNATTHKLSAYFDNILRVESTINLVSAIFNNDPMVYWGFSAATGGEYNVQQFCTALNPEFKTDFISNATCFGNAVTFFNQSQSFAPIKDYYWDFGDGTTSALINPPAHNYASTGVYKTKLAITGLDGCNSDTLERAISIGDTPVPLFDIFDTCSGKPPRIVDRSIVTVGNISKWNWTLDGTTISNSQLPQFGGAGIGLHQLQLTVESNIGCPATTTAIKSFTLKPIPVISFTTQDACLNQSVPFSGVQTDNATAIISWNWQFDDGPTISSQTTNHSYSSPGIKNIQLTANADNGCNSESISKTFLINEVSAFAGLDTIVLKNTLFKLEGKIKQTGTAPVNINWLPATGLDNDVSLVTQGKINDDQTYTLSVKTAEGCMAADDVKIIIFKGSAVYVPSGFTPNHDGKNENLKPYLVAIKKLYYFSVYNRWGQLIFTTKNAGEGWDGTFNGTMQQMGTYVWIVKAIDVVGNMYEKKGTTTLIR